MLRHSATREISQSHVAIATDGVRFGRKGAGGGGRR